jgi:hypothetical protein
VISFAGARSSVLKDYGLWLGFVVLPVKGVGFSRRFEKTSHWQALEHLSREETPFGILTAVPLMHDKALWINCLVRLQG